MSIQSGRQQVGTPWGAIFFALLGLIWCGYVAFPTSVDTQCITSGCDISRSFSIGGVSLWWIGGAYFFVLILLCLRGRRYFAWRLSQLALLLDTLLLGIMFFTGPCFDCLVVAVFIGLTTWLLRPPASGWFKGENTSSHFLLPLWFGLLLGNSVVAINESAPRWVIANEHSSSIIRVHFAPSCPWCREAVKVLGAKEKALLYPVLEEESDFNALLRFEAYIAEGMSVDEAIDACLDETAPLPHVSFARQMAMRVQLLRNKNFLFKHPQRSLPLIEINGMPVTWILQSSLPPTSAPTRLPQQNQPEAPAQPFIDEPLPWNEGIAVLQCEEGSVEPCD